MVEETPLMVAKSSPVYAMQIGGSSEDSPTVAHCPCPEAPCDSAQDARFPILYRIRHVLCLKFLHGPPKVQQQPFSEDLLSPALFPRQAALCIAPFDRLLSSDTVCRPGEQHLVTCAQFRLRFQLGFVALSALVLAVCFYFQDFASTTGPLEEVQDGDSARDRDGYKLHCG